MKKIKLLLGILSIGFLSSCEAPVEEEMSSMDKIGFAGLDGGAFIADQGESMDNWIKFCDLHSSKSIEAMMELCGDSIMVELKDGEQIKGKEAFREGLTNWMKDADVSIDQQWGVPLKFVNAEETVDDGVWLVTGHELKVKSGNSIHIEDNHVNVYMTDGVIQYMKVYTHKSSDVEGVEVTFSIDMSNYEGEFASVGVFGSFNSWCGSCNSLSDDDGDMVYEGTAIVPTGAMEYKFILDNQNIEESFEAGLECTNTTDVYTNRSADINSAVVLPTVCFNSCSSCE